MRIAIRADGNAHCGLGHIVRSTAIAIELRKLGADVIFITEDDKVALDKIRAAGFPVDIKPPGACNDAYTRKAYFDYHADILVLDIKHYFYHPEFIKKMRGWFMPVVMIDPQDEGAREASRVIFTNGHMMERAAIAYLPQERLFHGAEYTVMNPNVINAGQAPRDGRPPQILITTGGSDSKNILSQALWHMPPHTEKDFTIHVKAGEAFTHRKELADAFGRLPRFAKMMTQAEDISHITHAICTFGVTAYEMAYLGIPCLTIAHSEENIWGSRNFAELGMSIDGGYYKDLTADKFSSLLNELIDPGHQWRPIKGLDGKGAERVAKLILEVAK